MERFDTDWTEWTVWTEWTSCCCCCWMMFTLTVTFQCCRLDSPPADKTKRARGREKERHIPPADSQQRDDEDSGCSFVPHPWKVRSPEVLRRYRFQAPGYVFKENTKMVERWRWSSNFSIFLAHVFLSTSTVKSSTLLGAWTTSEIDDMLRTLGGNERNQTIDLKDA